MMFQAAITTYKSVVLLHLPFSIDLFQLYAKGPQRNPAEMATKRHQPTLKQSVKYAESWRQQGVYIFHESPVKVSCTSVTELRESSCEEDTYKEDADGPADQCHCYCIVELDNSKRLKKVMNSTMFCRARKNLTSKVVSSCCGVICWIW